MSECDLDKDLFFFPIEDFSKMGKKVLEVIHLKMCRTVKCPCMIVLR